MISTKSFHNGINSSYPVVFIFTAAVPFAGGIGPVRNFSTLRNKRFTKSAMRKNGMRTSSNIKQSKFLNMKHNLMMDTNKISIDSMKKACGFIDSVRVHPLTDLKKKNTWKTIIFQLLQESCLRNI